MEGHDSSSLTVVHYQGPNKAVRRGRRPRICVTDQQQAQSPAPKTKNACDRCRIKKARCSGRKPCLRCVRLKQTCIYMPEVTPPQSTSIVGNNQMELGSAAIGSSETQPMDCEHQHRSTDMPGDEFEHEDDEDFNNSFQSNKTPPKAPLDEDQYGHIHGGASVFTFLNITKQKLASLPAMSIDFCDYPLASTPHLPRVLPPKDIANQLVSTFFDFGLSTSRFVHEPSLRESYELLYANNGGKLQTDSLLLIYMVLAVGSHYSRKEDMWHGYSASVQFYEMADKLHSKLPTRITLTSIQYRLLVIHYLLNHSRMHEAWSLFGIVVRHAQALGLHDASRKPSGDHTCRQFRQRTFWVIYINDRILSSVFGRPCAIHDEDVDQEECLLSNDENITSSGCDIVRPDDLCLTAALVHYARLARILGNILRQFYCLSKTRQTMSCLHALATDFETSLANWLRGLPAYLNFAVLPSSALSVTLHRQVSTLKLTYAYANLLLYRPFILHSMESSASVGMNARLCQWVKRCHDQSLTAANMIVCECSALQKRGLFSKTFWMVNYCQFAALGTLYTYCLLWPNAYHVREVAEEARAQFPAGVQDDLVGRRYIEILNELSRITSNHLEHNNLETPGNLDHINHSPQRSESDTLATDEPTLDFGGIWDNLFFDSHIFDYAGEDII